MKPEKMYFYSGSDGLGNKRTLIHLCFDGDGINWYMYTPNKDWAMYSPPGNMPDLDFEVYIDGIKKEVSDVSVSSFSLIMFRFEGENAEETRAYDIKIVYTADPSRPIYYTGGNAKNDRILNSFTFQKTVICEHKGDKVIDD